MTEHAEFNPADKFTDLKGQLYLEVKWRVVWLRDDAPDSQIRCEHITLTDQLAVFKATITRIIDGEVKGVGEGYGSEQPKDFKDYIEKAETKAIGRALAALGYGTAAAFEENPERIADAPVKRPAPPAERTRTQQPQPTLGRATGQGNAPQGQARPMAGLGPSSEAQHRMLRGLARQTNPDPATMSDDRWLHGQMFARFQLAHLADLSKQHASALIDWFQQGDFIDCQWPPESGRVDPVEAHQQGLAAMPEEPAHLRAAPWD
jgi:hypothetical protein